MNNLNWTKRSIDYTCRVGFFSLRRGRVYQHPRRGTRGYATGLPRTSEHRNKPIQKRGYGIKCGEYYCTASVGCTQHETFYGDTPESAIRKALCYCRRLMRDTQLKLEAA